MQKVIELDINEIYIPPVRIVSGDLQTVGSEVAIGDEHFYIISSDEDSVTMLAKMNITTDTTPKQSSSASATAFSSTGYWSSTVSSYPAYVYDSNSTLYNYVENYRTYLESQGAEIEEARLIKKEELEALGCSSSDYSCSSAPSWVYATRYWSGSASSSIYVWSVRSRGDFSCHDCSYGDIFGCRPVITLTL